MMKLKSRKSQSFLMLEMLKADLGRRDRVGEVRGKFPDLT